MLMLGEALRHSDGNVSGEIGKFVPSLTLKPHHILDLSIQSALLNQSTPDELALEIYHRVRDNKLLGVDDSCGYYSDQMGNTDEEQTAFYRGNREVYQELSAYPTIHIFNLIYRWISSVR